MSPHRNGTRALVPLFLLSLLTSEALANGAVVRPVKDWTGDGRINRLDVVYYNVFLFNPAQGYFEWPRGNNGLLVYKFNCKETCHG